MRIRSFGIGQGNIVLMSIPPKKQREGGVTRRTGVGFLLAAPLLAGCANMGSPFGGGSEQPSGPPQQPTAVGSGQVKVGLVLPLSGAGNAGVAGQSMRNAAEMALAEFQNPDIRLLIKDDGGTAQGAQQGVQQALE